MDPRAAPALDELLERIKGELSKLGPILDLEVVREPGPRTNGGLTVANWTIEHDWRSGLEGRQIAALELAVEVLRGTGSGLLGQ